MTDGVTEQTRSVTEEKARAFDLLYRYAVDGESAESLKGEILGIGAFIAEM